jgi:hypothetical protein
MSKAPSIQELDELLASTPGQVEAVYQTSQRIDELKTFVHRNPHLSQMRRRRHWDARCALARSLQAICRGLEEHRDRLNSSDVISLTENDELQDRTSKLGSWTRRSGERHVIPLDSFDRARESAKQLAQLESRLGAVLPRDNTGDDGAAIPVPCKRLQKCLVQALVQADIIAGFEEQFERTPHSRHGKLHLEVHEDLHVLSDRIHDAKSAIPGVAKFIDPLRAGPPGEWTTQLKQHLSNLDRMVISNGWKMSSWEPELYRATMDAIQAAQAYLANADYSAIPSQGNNASCDADGTAPLAKRDNAEGAGTESDEDDKPAPEKPSYDKEKRELTYAGKTVKQFRQKAKNQEKVLLCFVEDGWPTAIDAPLKPSQLKDTVRALNESQNHKLLRFELNGSGEQILWRAVETAE